MAGIRQRGPIRDGSFRQILSTRCSTALAKVPGMVEVSPWSAAYTSAATTVPVSRSIACSGLQAKCVRPSFILAIFALSSDAPTGAQCARPNP